MRKITVVTAAGLAGLMLIAALPLPAIGSYQFLKEITFFGGGCLFRGQRHSDRCQKRSERGTG